MVQETGIQVSPFKAADRETIKEMIRIYQEAYKNDKSVQLRYTLPNLLEKMAKTITLHLNQPVYDFLVARTESSNHVVGWLSLAYKSKEYEQISEEHALLAQYALVPDIVEKGRKVGIGKVEMKDIAQNVFRDFKEAREKQLPDRHCLISTIVVDPEHKNKGVASTLLSKAISRCEDYYSIPMWVQAPESCQSLFANQDFEEVCEYRLDLNEYVPMLDTKRKAAGPPALGRYSWMFMMRKEPLEKYMREYAASQVFAEEEAKRRVDERRWKVIEQRSSSQASGKDKAAPRLPDSVLVKDVQTARGERLVARDDAEAGPSTPLPTKSSTKDG